MGRHGLNSRMIMLAIMAIAIGGLLSIPVIQYYMPKPGQVSMNEPRSGSP